MPDYCIICGSIIEGGESGYSGKALCFDCDRPVKIVSFKPSETDALGYIAIIDGVEVVGEHHRLILQQAGYMWQAFNSEKGIDTYTKTDMQHKAD